MEERQGHVASVDSHSRPISSRVKAFRKTEYESLPISCVDDGNKTCLHCLHRPQVTDLKNSGVPKLRMKVFCSPADAPNEGGYLKDYQVDIDGHREVSSDKYFKLASHMLHKSIELRIFTDRGFSGVALTPWDIRTHVRITFMKHKDYENTGEVLVKGIAKANLPNPTCYIARRGFGKLRGRNALYDTLKESFIVGSSDQVPSSTLIESGQRSDEQTPTHQVSSSNSMRSGQLSEEQTPWIEVSSSNSMRSGQLSEKQTPWNETTKGLLPMNFTRSVSCKARSHKERF